MGDHSVMVSDDGTGHAKIERIYNPGQIGGVIDPLSEINNKDASGHYKTIAGALIAKMAPVQAAEALSSYAPSAVDNVKSAALGAASNLGNSIGGMFGGLFAPQRSASPTLAQLQAIRAVPPNSYYRAVAPMPQPRPSFLLQAAQRAPVMPAPMPVAIAAQRAAQQQAERQQNIDSTNRTLGLAGNSGYW
jgi:hypothetical protein